MVAPAPLPTPEQLIETLAEAGELDVGVEVLDALRLRDPSAPIVRLQARLFDAPDDPPPDAKRAALAPWREGALDRLQQRGAFLEVAAALRLMARVFADEPGWAERHARAEALVAPLPNPHGDPARAAADAAVARGDVADAWDRARSLARNEPGDPALAARVELLRDVVYPPAETRPYEALREPDDPAAVTTLAARIPQRLKAGDLQGALLDATTLAGPPGASPRWARFRDALERLVAWSTATMAAAGDEEVTTRTGPIERVELWLRAGQLGQARDALRQQVAVAPQHLAAQLTERLADLDAVLDTTLPTPVPVRPSSQAHVAISVARPTAPPYIPPPSAPPPAPEALAAPPAPVLTQPAGTEDTEPARPHLAHASPLGAPPSEPPSLPPESPSQPPDTPSMPPSATGDVRVGKRKIVRLE